MQFRTAALAFGAALTMSTSALAQQSQEMDLLRAHCTGDYMRLCSQFDPGSKQVEQCFQSNMRNLTPNCRQTIAYFRKKNPKGRGL